ncbi:hypothetical protein, partial [uncultured Wocania sp.]|uniref:hypothetical protein n=1 Tax=uncultured Wocania sp. TaxID=2834404 RepID=UPI0030F792EB
MKKIFLLLTLLISTSVFAQLPPAFQADGIQVPFTRFESLTTVQRDALTPVEGDFIYNTDIKSNQYYNGTTWISYQKEIKSYTTVQRDALTPDNFDVIYNSTDTVLQYWDGDSWEALGGVDQSANYTWTGEHSFDNANTYFGNNVKITNQPSVEVEFGTSRLSLLYNELEFVLNASNRIGIVTNPNTSGNFDLYTPVLT